MDRAEVVSAGSDTNEVLFKLMPVGLIAKLRFCERGDESEVLIAARDIGLPADYKSFRIMGKDSSDLRIRQSFLIAGLTAALQRNKGNHLHSRRCCTFSSVVT